MQVIVIEVGEHAHYLAELLTAQSDLLSSLSVDAECRCDGTSVRVVCRQDRTIRLSQLTRWVTSTSLGAASGDTPPMGTLAGEGRSLIRLCIAGALARVVRERVAVEYMASIVEGIGSSLSREERAKVLDEAIRQAYAGEINEEYSLACGSEDECGLSSCLSGLDDGQVSGTIRVDHVFIKLYECLGSSDDLSLEGFLRFRLRDYLARLRSAVYRAIDGFLLDQQQREFVELLRYFAEVQSPRTDSVTVVRDADARLRFYDAHGELIDTDGLLDGLGGLVDCDFSVEDILIGLLIAIAPARVLICMRGGRVLFETTLRVFRGRVLVCDGCSCCRLFEGSHEL